MKKPTSVYCTFSRASLAIAVTIGLLGVASGTARADDWNDHERQARDWHERHRHHHDHPQQVIEEPDVVYAPPVVVEQPPAPESDDSSSGINIVIPLNFH